MRSIWKHRNEVVFQGSQPDLYGLCDKIKTRVPLWILSKGKYKAVFHRSTVNKDTKRMSWPVFLEPPEELEVGPHPKLVNDDDNPPKFKTKKYKDYVHCKLNKLPQ
ncbi:unnamed protein product [Camellia sinensis]